MLFVLGTREGPTVQKSRAAVIKARELLRKLDTKDSSARRCCESLRAIPGAARGLEELQRPNLLPRTYFMQATGAFDPNQPAQGVGFGSSEGTSASQ